jgi:CRISPR/Cas system CMR-associated protein Cmr5 small subunit
LLLFSLSFILSQFYSLDRIKVSAENKKSSDKECVKVINSAINWIIAIKQFLKRVCEPHVLTSNGYAISEREKRVQMPGTDQKAFCSMMLAERKNTESEGELHRKP